VGNARREEVLSGKVIADELKPMPKGTSKAQPSEARYTSIQEYSDGNTALHIASFFAHAEFVKLLLEKGASGSVKSGRGETPLDVVSAEWSPQLEGIYKSIGDLIGIELDLARIRETRPKVARLLREHAALRAPGYGDPTGLSQSSSIRPRTRENSPTLLVTSVNP